MSILTTITTRHFILTILKLQLLLLTPALSNYYFRLSSPFIYTAGEDVSIKWYVVGVVFDPVVLADQSEDKLNSFETEESRTIYFTFGSQLVGLHNS